MARQSGIFKVEGTLDDVTFFRRGDKFMVRKKGGISKQKIMNDANFVRTRENMSEFANVATAGKIVRNGGAALFRRAYDAKLCNRLTSVFSKVKNLDITSPRGQRQVAIGLATPAGKDLFRGFQFNEKAPLNTVLFTPYSLAVATGAISITDLVPQDMLNVPAHATHVSFCAGLLVVDFDTGQSELGISTTQHLAINMTAGDVVLIPDHVPTLPGIKMHLLLIAFHQEINGLEYSLNDGVYNAVGLVGIE